MTAPTDFLSDTQPIPVGVPDHLASSGQSGEPTNVIRTEGGTRPGIFGRGTRTRADKPALASKPKKERSDIPKLGPHMRQKITDFYILIGGMIMPFDQMAGETFIEQAPKCGKAVYDYAQENAAFRRVIQGFLTTSMTGALIFAHLPIILVLLRHSRREGIRLTAASMMVAMKMMDQETANDVFPTDEEKAADTVDG